MGLVSCGDDDYSIEYVDTEVKTELTGTISLGSTGAAISAMVPYNFTLPQSFEVESVLEVTAVSSYSTLAIDPYIVVMRDTIPAGTTSGSGMIEMPGTPEDEPEFSGISGYADVSLTGIALVQPEDEDEDDGIDPPKIDDPFTLSSESASIAGYGFVSPWMETRTNTLMIAMDWEGPYNCNDIDLYVYNQFGLFEASETGDRYEGDFFNYPVNNDFPDGDYIVEIAIWTFCDANPIPWRLYFTRDDGSVETFEGVVDPAVGYVDPVLISQTTDSAGVRTWVLSEL